ncbi:hypothetical protein DICPUDRAFT_25724 [Dictyostelium purpureum]|uniref:EF-hand domain-containing protein n=1 Tax=Dictyostelium purpureum TaxID=5786 RepID=F0Z7L5_DICPU|nr:uncharacterized protein DICPUDRAFT_25724 [Dictyostelium purpureum]EGC40082.1 hypothetical protein DICPUDRAFT_25724 [Dictyostelium purpureum]|eukprot:XP_003283431.1 hypothetical protein DICPUDRAFT_25724 [Dictyostelium purpureum]
MGNGSTKLSLKELDVVSKSTNFSKQEIQKLYKDFKKNDKDRNGTFNQKEFIKFFKSKLPNFPEDQLLNFFKLFDFDKSNSIDFNEASIALSIFGKNPVKNKLEILFGVYDDHRCGYLGKREIKQLVTLIENIGSCVGKEDSILVFQNLDQNKNYIISSDQWIREGSENKLILCILENF